METELPDMTDDPSEPRFGSDNVVRFPPTSPPLLLGPFETYRVVVEGRAIPKLTGERSGPDKTTLIVDGRLCIDVPNDLAPQVAWLVANALAVGAGYPCLSAESRDQQCFAPLVQMVD